MVDPDGSSWSQYRGIRPEHVGLEDLESYLVSVDPDWNAKCPGEAEVGYFDDALLVDEKVLWLQVAVQYPALVAEQDALEQLRKTRHHWQGNTQRATSMKQT